jgi:hypothetical protein
MSSKKTGSGTKTNDKDAAKRKILREAQTLEQQYKSQHCDSEEVTAPNRIFDMIGLEGLKAIAPMYRSGINPNFFDDYFSGIEKSDQTNTAECRAIVWNEYESRRWSYAQHLAGYHDGGTQKKNREVETVELWRRLHGRSNALFTWYFDDERKIGDVLHRPAVKYTQGVSVLHANFANCSVCPKHTLRFGSTHVAVGFVDLGLLLDSKYLERTDKQESECLLFRGFEANEFSVAKSSVLWDMICTEGTKASWVVQVWFSSVWSKRATNAFLAAARRVAGTESTNSSVPKFSHEAHSLLNHWASSKGVGLKKLVKRRGQTRKESSAALFFAHLEDRAEMLRYHLTGAFGLGGEELCSSSIVMFDCPNTSHKIEAASVFDTLTLSDVVSSDLYNGSYFQTAERVKERRVELLMEYAKAEKIKIQLSVHTLSPKSVAQIEEIARLEPVSISWSNVLDYMSREEFHFLAKSCGPNAIHSGYSMNWPTQTYGASLIDYPDTSTSVIRKAEKATVSSMKDLCNQRRIFLLPIQHNPLNTTASFLANRCYSHWVEHFFGHPTIEVIETGMMDHLGNPLSRIAVVVSNYWTYKS